MILTPLNTIEYWNIVEEVNNQPIPSNVISIDKANTPDKTFTSNLWRPKWQNGKLIYPKD